MADQKKIRGAISIRNVTKVYDPDGVNVMAVDDCSLEIAAGEVCMIVGPSGCGKTTLLNLLARLDFSDTGELYWNGESYDPKLPPGPRDAARRACLIGVVYQAYYLIPEMNVLENVLLAARLAGSMGKDAKQRARELLDRVGVSNRERQLPQKLSGGERQRVAIARALLNRPKVIMADEPTGNLDERSAGDVMELLLEACREEEAGLVLVTHNPSFAKATDEALNLVKGELSHS